MPTVRDWNRVHPPREASDCVAADELLLDVRRPADYAAVCDPFRLWHLEQLRIGPRLGPANEAAYAEWISRFVVWGFGGGFCCRLSALGGIKTSV